MKILRYGSKCRNAGLSGIQSLWYQNEKTNGAGTGRYQTKLMQSGILFRYRTEIMDAGIPMPALVSSMPMPSFATYVIPHNTLYYCNTTVQVVDTGLSTGCMWHTIPKPGISDVLHASIHGVVVHAHGGATWLVVGVPLLLGPQVYYWIILNYSSSLSI